MPTMKAIGFAEHGGPEVLRLFGVPVPVPRPRDLLVRVEAAAANPVDGKVRTGSRSGAAASGGPTIIGWDASGVVEAVGREVEGFAPGDAHEAVGTGHGIGKVVLSGAW